MNIYKSPQVLKHLPNATSYLCRKLLLIQHIYVKYKKLKDEITNKQIQYMIANDGIFSGELEPNPEAYLRQYNTIIEQSQTAQSLLVQNEDTISQCLDCIEQLLQKLSLGSDQADTITQNFQQNDIFQPQVQDRYVQEDQDYQYQQKQMGQSISQTKSEKNLKLKYKTKQRQKHKQMNNKSKTKFKTKYGSLAKSKCKLNSQTKYPSKLNSNSKSKHRKENNSQIELQKQKKSKSKYKSKAKAKAKAKAKSKSDLNLTYKYQQGTYIKPKQADLQHNESFERNSSQISLNIES